MDKIVVQYTTPHGIFFQQRKIDNQYRVKAMSHFEYEIVYLLSGRITMVINGKEYEVHAGDMVIVDLHEFHSTDMFEGVDTEMMVAQFSPDVLPPYVNLKFSDYCKTNFMFPHRIAAKYVEQSKVAEIMQSIADLLLSNEKKTYMEIYIASHLLRLVAEVNKVLDNFAKTETMQLDETGRKGAVLNQCIRYINENIYKNISIEEIAKNCFVSCSYLQHLFKKEVGVSVSEFILTKKMSLARYWLILGRSPTKVALDLGYEYYTTFCAKFKKFYGVSPKNLNFSVIVENVLKE